MWKGVMGWAVVSMAMWKATRSVTRVVVYAFGCEDAYFIFFAGFVDELVAAEPWVGVAELGVCDAAGFCPLGEGVDGGVDLFGAVAVGGIELVGADVEAVGGGGGHDDFGCHDAEDVAGGFAVEVEVECVVGVLTCELGDDAVLTCVV